MDRFIIITFDGKPENTGVVHQYNGNIANNIFDKLGVIISFFRDKLFINTLALPSGLLYEIKLTETENNSVVYRGE